jgi:hypothetical protein
MHQWRTRNATRHRLESELVWSNLEPELTQQQHQLRTDNRPLREGTTAMMTIDHGQSV